MVVEMQPGGRTRMLIFYKEGNEKKKYTSVPNNNNNNNNREREVDIHARLLSNQIKPKPRYGGNIQETPEPPTSDKGAAEEGSESNAD
jgi:hypothetical protein